MMVKSLLAATGIDVETVKGEAMQRIENFEHSVATLNARLKSIDANLRAICAHHGIEYVAPEEIPAPQNKAA